MTIDMWWMQVQKYKTTTSKFHWICDGNFSSVADASFVLLRFVFLQMHISYIMLSFVSFSLRRKSLFARLFSSYGLINISIVSQIVWLRHFFANIFIAKCRSIFYAHLWSTSWQFHRLNIKVFVAKCTQSYGIYSEKKIKSQYQVLYEYMVFKSQLIRFKPYTKKCHENIIFLSKSLILAFDIKKQFKSIHSFFNCLVAFYA